MKTYEDEVEEPMTQDELEDKIFRAGEEDFPLKFKAEDLDNLIMIFHETGHIRYPELEDDGETVLVYEEYDPGEWVRER